MSTAQYENSGVSTSNNYVMLNNYCGKSSVPLGVKNVAPIFAPYGADPMYQDIPVFKGVNYDQAPYENPIMYRCDQCSGTYCNALQGYGWPTDKAGNPLTEAVYNQNGQRTSGYESVAYVSRGPNQSVNQSSAVDNNSMGFKPTAVNPMPYNRR